MQSSRYFPKKYRQDSRSRRLRHRNRIFVIVSILIVILAAGGFFLFRWLKPGKSGQAPKASATIAAVQPSQSTTPEASGLVASSAAVLPSAQVSPSPSEPATAAPTLTPVDPTASGISASSGDTAAPSVT